MEGLRDAIPAGLRPGAPASKAKQASDPTVARGISGGPLAPSKSMWFFGVFSVTHAAKPYAVQQEEHDEDLVPTVGR